MVREKGGTRRVLDDIEDFVGWGAIVNLANSCMETPYYMNPHPIMTDATGEKMREKLRTRDRALVSALFLLGGRVSEILMSRVDNFLVEEDFILVSNLPALKRYKKIKEEVERLYTFPPEGATGYEWNPDEGCFIKYRKYTIPCIEERRPFPVPKWEPLSDYLLEYVASCESWLFPSRYSVKRSESPGVQKWIEEKYMLDNNVRAWLSPQRAFQIVSKASERIGLVVEKDRVNAKGIWNHWFRSQRVTQVGRDYQFANAHKNRFFGWAQPRDATTASLYSRVGEMELEEQMIENRERHERFLKRDFQRWKRK